jgi:basic membrane protein A and related proteins
MKKRVELYLVVLLVLGLSLASCTQPSATPQPAQPTEAPKATTQPVEAPKATVAPASEGMSVALLLPGSIGDAGWNANAYKGLQEIEKQGIKTAFTESVPVPDIEAAFRGYAEQGYDLVIGHGYEFGEPAIKIGAAFPDTKFAVSGKAPPNLTIPPNVGFTDQQEFQGAYLSGVLAGLTTKSNKIGYVGGMEIPTQLANLAAYTKGAQSVNPKVQILGVLTGTFEDPTKGAEAAKTQIANGADVIMQTADSTGMGAIQAASEAGVWIIGYGADQKEVAPKQMLSSLVIHSPKAIASQIDLMKNGTFGGKVWTAGIKEGIIDIAPFGDMVSKDVQDKVMAVKDDIVSGKFQVPEIYERVDQ